MNEDKCPKCGRLVPPDWDGLCGICLSTYDK